MPQSKGFGESTGRIKLEESNDRMGFIRKVYMILATQLIFTTIITIIPLVSDSAKDYLYNNIWILIVAAIFSIALSCALICVRSLARKVPTNYILLGLFTLCESLIVAYSAAATEPRTVVMAACLTAAIVIGLTVYAITTKTDFTTCLAAAWMLGFLLLGFGLMAIIFQSYVVTVVYCALAVIVFGFYLIIDTQLVVGGRTHQLCEDEYIMGALILYIDIVVLFLKLLAILGRR